MTFLWYHLKLEAFPTEQQGTNETKNISAVLPLQQLGFQSRGEKLQIQPKKSVAQIHKILALHYLVW